VSDTRTTLESIFKERIAVLDGAWGVDRGGTHGSPTYTLLFRSAWHWRELGLPPGEARLRPRMRSAGKDA
jgi:hypothetical protein